METLQIREATEGDAEGLVLFMARLANEGLPVLFKGMAVPSVDEERDFVRRFRKPQDGVCLVAVDGETVVGVLDFHREKRAQVAHGGEFGMSVDREYRRQGVGTALLRALIAWARAEAVTRLQLQVFENNRPAIGLYESMGFQTEGRRRGAVVVAGTPIDVLLMARIADISEAHAR